MVITAGKRESGMEGHHMNSITWAFVKVWSALCSSVRPSDWEFKSNRNQPTSWKGHRQQSFYIK